MIADNKKGGMMGLDKQINDAFGRAMSANVAGAIKKVRAKKQERFDIDNYQVMPAVDGGTVDMANYDFLNFWFDEITTVCYCTKNGLDLKDYDAVKAWDAIGWYRAQVKNMENEQ